MWSYIAGFIIATVTVAAAVAMLDVDSTLYLNNAGLLIVIGGSVAAAVGAFGVTYLRMLLVGCLEAIRGRQGGLTEMTAIIARLSEAGTSTSEQAYAVKAELLKASGHHPLMSRGLQYLEGQLEPELMEELLLLASYERRDTLQGYVDALTQLGKYPPAFGMVGSVVGLISLLYSLGSAGADATSQIGT